MISGLGGCVDACVRATGGGRASSRTQSNLVHQVVCIGIFFTPEKDSRFFSLLTYLLGLLVKEVLLCYPARVL